MKNISNYYVNFYEDTNILMPIFDCRNLSLDYSYELSVCLVTLVYTVRHMERISHYCTTGSRTPKGHVHTDAVFGAEV